MSLLRREKDARRRGDPADRPVLVVEDDAGIRGYLVEILERYGYDVVAAASGEEALQRLAGRKARLAVLDVGLPGMDGFAVAEQLGPETPVIVVTGDPLRAKVRAFGRMPAPTILAKPLNLDLFEAAVQAAL
jgi:DNA-binding response OmpR family regulator